MNAIQAAQNGHKRIDWRQIGVLNLRGVRLRMKAKYSSLTEGAKSLNVDYSNLSNTICGRRATFAIVAALQKDLELTNDDVLRLWPLIKQWPREVA